MQEHRNTEFGDEHSAEKETNETPQGDSAEGDTQQQTGEQAAAATPSTGSSGSSNSADNDTGRPSSGSKSPAIIAGIVIVLALVIGGGILWSDKLQGMLSGTTGATGSPAGNGTGGNSDETVAVVGGTEITRGELERRASQQGLPRGEGTGAQQQRQILDNMVNEEVLYQHAQDQVSVSDSEVQDEMDNFSSRYDSEEALNQALQQQNLTKDDLRQQVRRQLTIQKFVEGYRSDNPVEVSDEEIQEMYDSISSQRNEAPPLSQVRPQLKEQITQQKLQEKLLSFIEELKQNIEVNIQL